MEAHKFRTLQLAPCPSPPPPSSCRSLLLRLPEAVASAAEADAGFARVKTLWACRPAHGAPPLFRTGPTGERSICLATCHPSLSRLTTTHAHTQEKKKTPRNEQTSSKTLGSALSRKSLSTRPENSRCNLYILVSRAAINDKSDFFFNSPSKFSGNPGG